MLIAAKKPVIYAGGGILLADAAPNWRNSWTGWAFRWRIR